MSRFRKLTLAMVSLCLTSLQFQALVTNPASAATSQVSPASCAANQAIVA